MPIVSPRLGQVHHVGGLEIGRVSQPDKRPDFGAAFDPLFCRRLRCRSGSLRCDNHSAIAPTENDRSGPRLDDDVFDKTSQTDEPPDTGTLVNDAFRTGCTAAQRCGSDVVGLRSFGLGSLAVSHLGIGGALIPRAIKPAALTFASSTASCIKAHALFLLFAGFGSVVGLYPVWGRGAYT